MIILVDNTKKTELWHRKLGHICENGMKMLVKDDMIPEQKSMEHHTYESSILRKQKRVSFSSGSRELKAEKLELVHTDVWGASPVASLEGSRYFVTFIDESIRNV